MESPLDAEHRADRIAVFLPSLEGGGAERSMLNLVKGFLAHGRTVDLVLCQAKGAYLGEIPEGATMIELKPTGSVQTRWIAAKGNPGDFFALLRPILLAGKIAPEIARIRSLQHYIEEYRPDAILSALTYANLVAIWAKHSSDSRVPVVVSERIALATYCAAPSNYRKWRWRYLPEVVRRTYRGADRVVAVSQFVAQELINKIQLDESSVTALHNPVVDDSLRSPRAAGSRTSLVYSPGGARGSRRGPPDRAERLCHPDARIRHSPRRERSTAGYPGRGPVAGRTAGIGRPTRDSG